MIEGLWRIKALPLLVSICHLLFYFFPASLFIIFQLFGLFQNQEVDSVIFPNVSAFDPDNGRGSTIEYSLTVSVVPFLCHCFCPIDD